MKCIRASANGRLVCELLEPHLLPSDTMDKTMMMALLSHHIDTKNPNIAIYVLFNDEQTECIGFTILETPVGHTHVFIHQTWLDAKKAGRKGGDILMSRMIAYAKHMGRSSLRAETNRSEKAFERSRNFRIVSHTIEYRINDVFEEFFQHTSEVRNNEQEQQTTRDNGVDATAEGSGEPALQLPDGSEEPSGGRKLRATGPGSHQDQSNLGNPDRNEDASTVHASDGDQSRTTERGECPIGLEPNSGNKDVQSGDIPSSVGQAVNAVQPNLSGSRPEIANS